MNAVYAEWIGVPDISTKVPSRIEVRVCPNDHGHWKVSEDHCPVCNAEIVTLNYKLV
jgi:hypothetical protein